MASGSSGRSGFDFGADDVLGSYNDYSNQDISNGNQQSIDHGTNSTKDFRDSRMGRPAFVPAYNQSDESHHQELISTVEKTMKKYADNLLRFLEGISARLSQLELYCYNLEKSVGEMKSDLVRENREADTKLSSLEKHLQEVHRSIQILRDKQELADTQKELAKLQLVHKEEVVTPSTTSDLKKLDNPPEVQKQQLALALPHQVSPPTSLPPPMSHPPQISSQPTYYPQQTPVPTSMPTQLPQDRYMQADPQYQRSQLQISQPPAPPSQPQQQSQPMPSYPSYQQQWSQQYPQQPPLQPQQQQPAPQTQISQQAPPPPSYSPYPPPNQAANPPPPEAVNYGYGGGANRASLPQPPPPLQQRPQPPQSSYGAPLGDSTYPPRQGYMVYEGEGGRVPSHFPQGAYANPVRHQSPSQMMRNTPYNELAEKAVSMGYGRDFVLSVIHSMEESGQPMDFNTLLDRLNMHSSGGSQRAWSG
ncbi:hypothetical protein ACHQM5_003202 [Ranunculus cassubicifolius]